jgi:hypothetical protein
MPEQERAAKDRSLDLENSDLPMQRALGVNWDAESDTLGVGVTIRDKPKTRRGIISVTSSVYDPLAMVSPFVLPAKKLIQELWRRGAG